MPKPSIDALFLLNAYLLLLAPHSGAKNTLQEGDFLHDDGNSGSNLTSGDFILHFFSPNGSGKRYLGISYVIANFSRVVWVANRDNPLTDRTGVLNISTHGNLTLYQESTSKTIWSSNSSTTGNAIEARLTDVGNLVLVGSENGESVWESFDHPTDTMLPDMRIGTDRFLTSWKSESDPSPGNFTYRLRSGGGGSCEIYITAANGSISYRTGPWNDRRRQFSGNPNLLTAGDDINFDFSNCSYYKFDVRNSKRYSMSWLVLHPSGRTERNATENGSVLRQWTRTPENCDQYNRCGKNAVCMNASTCACLPGFEQVRQGRGCQRQEQLGCGESCDFKTLEKVKLPDTANATVGRDVGDCTTECRKDPSCVAYAVVHVFQNSNQDCIRWSGDLLDTMVFVDIKVLDPDELFLKLTGDRKKYTKTVVIVAAPITIFAAILLVVTGVWMWRRTASHSPKAAATGSVYSLGGGDRKWTEEFSLFDYDRMVSVTANFSERIGAGGFGDVYKGVMEDGQVVAVKRLKNRVSESGMQEFLNEATLIARLQHRNLVKLLGCCTDRGERMLVYEFLSNKSLDTFIFDRRQRPMLQWRTRANIIAGVSRAILYLHDDSRLKIIHRDIKAANVLLDGAMNPKISDFGTAKIFMADQSDDQTNTVIGTPGYLAPEYAMEGTFSAKSDVFSFGVLMLEIISGKRNGNGKASARKRHNENLLSLAWNLWNDGDGLKLVDEMIMDWNPMEVERYIQIGLLCVQESAADRPTMFDANSMLTNEEKNLSKPNRPGIYHGHITRNAVQDSSGSVSKLTITVVEGR